MKSLPFRFVAFAQGRFDVIGTPTSGRFDGVRIGSILGGYYAHRGGADRWCAEIGSTVVGYYKTRLAAGFALLKAREGEALALAGAEVRALMRKYRITIAALAARMQIPLSRVREARQKGVGGRAYVMDWQEAITGPPANNAQVTEEECVSAAMQHRGPP